MSARIKYTNEPIGEPRVIKDFLPSPSELAFRDEDVKITITIDGQNGIREPGEEHGGPPGSSEVDIRVLALQRRGQPGGIDAAAGRTSAQEVPPAAA